MSLNTWCTRIITWGFYLLFILVPVILTPWNYELFEYNKMIVTYGLTTIIMAAWIVKMVAEKEIRIAKTPLDIPIVLFVISQFVSTLFSMDPHVSWNGYYSRFNGGMWSVISYVLLYYAFVSNFFQTLQSSVTESKIEISESKKKKKLQHMTAPEPGLTLSVSQSILTLLKVVLSTATIVSLYGVAERLGIDKHLWVQDVQNRVFSSMGQPNWLAAYLVALIPVSMALGFRSLNLKSKKLWSPTYVFWTIISILFFVVLLFTRSRSGLAGFAVADCLFWLIVFFKTQEKRPFLRSVGILHAVFALIIFFNGSGIHQIDRYLTLEGIQTMVAKTATTQPITRKEAPAGPVLETGGTESGTIRKYVWQGAIAAWQNTTKALLIGTGTETFAFAFYQYRPAGHNLTSEWDFLYNKAHNEYLNYLATTGAVGLISYMILIGATILWFIRSLHRNADAVLFALFAGWISLLITNFFGFSVVITQIFLFLFPAMLFVADSRLLQSQYRKKITTAYPNLVTMGASAGMLVLLTIIALRWQADTLYATSYRLSRAGQYTQALPLIERALKLNPGEPIYHDEIATTLAALAMASAEQKNASAASELAKQSLTQSDRAINTSPKNVNFWKTRTKIYYSLASYDPTMNEAAIGALSKARELSPNDPKIYYNLAILSGRTDRSDDAITLLLKAKELKIDYHDAYYALYVFYTDMKKPDLARAMLQEYLDKVDANDQQFTELLTKP